MNFKFRHPGAKGNIPERDGIDPQAPRCEYYETITELIAKQFEMAKLDEARQGSVVQVADVAVPG